MLPVKVMLTVKEITVRANVCSSIVYGWIESGRLAHYRLGASGKRGAIRVDPADLDQFLADQKQGGRQNPPHEALPPAAKAAEPKSTFRHLRVR